MQYHLSRRRAGKLLCQEESIGKGRGCPIKRVSRGKRLVYRFLVQSCHGTGLLVDVAFEGCFDVGFGVSANYAFYGLSVEEDDDGWYTHDGEAAWHQLVLVDVHLGEGYFSSILCG